MVKLNSNKKVKTIKIVADAADVTASATSYTIEVDANQTTSPKKGFAFIYSVTDSAGAPKAATSAVYSNATGKLVITVGVVVGDVVTVVGTLY